MSTSERRKRMSRRYLTLMHDSLRNKEMLPCSEEDIQGTKARYIKLFRRKSKIDTWLCLYTY
jgi:hypothetical protein